MEDEPTLIHCRFNEQKQCVKGDSHFCILYLARIALCTLVALHFEILPHTFNIAARLKHSSTRATMLLMHIARQFVARCRNTYEHSLTFVPEKFDDD